MVVYLPDIAYDIVLNGKGYLLARQEQMGTGGRAWRVSTVGASIGRQTDEESRYGNQPANVEIPMVWTSLDLGYGDEEQERERRYNYGYNVDCRFPNQVLPGPYISNIALEGATDNVTKMVDFDGDTYILAGRYLYKVERNPEGENVADDGETREIGYPFWYHDWREDPHWNDVDSTEPIDTDPDDPPAFAAGNILTQIRDFGQFRKGLDMVVFDDALYISTFYTEDMVHTMVGAWWGRAGPLERVSLNGSITSSNEVMLGYMTVLDDTLWAQTDKGEVSSCADDPFEEEDWSAGYTVGDPGLPITAVEGLLELLYIAKEDGLYALDSSGIAVQVTPELRAYRHEDNGKALTMWHGSVWMNHIRGLLNCQPLGDAGFSVGSVGPGREAAVSNPIRGLVTAIAGDDRWLYIAMLTSDGDTHLLAGRETHPNESELGEMLWHTLARVPQRECRYLELSGSWDNPRLFLGLSPGMLSYIVLPRGADNPYQDENCRYSLYGSLFLPAHSWLTPITTKVWKSIEIQADNVSLASFLKIFYRIDRGSWVYVGTVTQSPKQTFLLASQGVPGSSIEIRVDYVLSQAHVPFVIRAIIVRGAERPSTVETIDAVIRCSDRLRLRNNIMEPRQGATMLTELKALARLDHAVLLKDVIGLERYVLVLAPVEETETQYEGELPREVLATVHMSVFLPDVTTLPASEQTPSKHVFALNILAEGSGMEIPLEVPISIGVSSDVLDTWSTLVYTGPLRTLPILRITGPVTDLVIVNTTTGYELDFTGTTIEDGYVYLADAEANTLLDQGDVSHSSELVGDSSLENFYLVPGDNVFHITGTDLSETTDIRLYYL